MYRLNVLVFIATAVYIVIDKYIGIQVAPYVYLGFFAFAGLNYFFIKSGFIEISKMFGLTVFNLMVFAVATSEPFETGMHVHFISTGAVALALYGYEQWKGAILFVLLSFSLDILTITTDIRIIPWRDVDPEQAHIFFILNTVICAFVCVYTILLYSKINYESEMALQQHDTLIAQQNEMLVKANAELDRFVYSASHDLRAPLSTLTGLINLSEMEKEDHLKQEYLQLMKKRVKAMDSFISEIIDYARNSRLEVDHERIDLKELLQEIYKELRFTEGWETVEATWDFKGPLIVVSDETRVKMVFTNLISNAIKYRDVDKRKSTIKILGRVEGKFAVVSIEDNGLGISAELLPRVFDMFFRAHHLSRGSGLGLYISRETISKLDGDITASSQEGVGSKFTVVLPLDHG